jgi:hypothetical protein
LQTLAVNPDGANRGSTAQLAELRGWILLLECGDPGVAQPVTRHPGNVRELNDSELMTPQFLTQVSHACGRACHTTWVYVRKSISCRHDTPL